MSRIRVMHEGGHWRAHAENGDRFDANRIVANWAEIEDLAAEQGITIVPGVLDVADTAAFSEYFGPPPPNVKLH
jgi:hypothetical protein